VSNTIINNSDCADWAYSNDRYWNDGHQPPGEQYYAHDEPRLIIKNSSSSAAIQWVATTFAPRLHQQYLDGTGYLLGGLPYYRERYQVNVPASVGYGPTTIYWINKTMDGAWDSVATTSGSGIMEIHAPSLDCMDDDTGLFHRCPLNPAEKGRIRIVDSRGVHRVYRWSNTFIESEWLDWARLEMIQ